MNSNEEKPENEREREREHRRHRHEGRRFWGCRGRWKFALIFAVIVLVKGALVMALWNALIPDLFHGPIVNFYQALGLVVLAKLLTGVRGMHRFDHHRHDHWRKHLKSHWEALSDEEREKLREKMHERMHGRFDRDKRS